MLLQNVRSNYCSSVGSTNHHQDNLHNKGISTRLLLWLQRGAPHRTTTGHDVNDISAGLGLKIDLHVLLEPGVFWDSIEAEHPIWLEIGKPRASKMRSLGFCLGPKTGAAGSGTSRRQLGVLAAQEVERNPDPHWMRGSVVQRPSKKREPCSGKTIFSGATEKRKKKTGKKGATEQVRRGLGPGSNRLPQSRLARGTHVECSPGHTGFRRDGSKASAGAKEQPGFSREIKSCWQQNNQLTATYY